MEKKAADSTQLHDDASLSQPKVAPGEIIIGTLTGFNKEVQPLVNFKDNPVDHPLVALTTQSVSPAHIGRQVALLFANANLQSPVIMGLIHSPLQDMLENYQQPATHESTDENIELETTLKVDDVHIDGKKIVFTAEEEIVLKCGESSITLTKAGKVLIRGKYLLNRSTGVNRIMGGSVQVN